MGGNPTYPSLSPQMTARDAQLVKDIGLDVVRHGTDDPIAALQIEADIIVHLAGTSVADEHCSCLDTSTWAKQDFLTYATWPPGCTMDHDS